MTSVKSRWCFEGRFSANPIVANADEAKVKGGQWLARCAAEGSNSQEQSWEEIYTNLTFSLVTKKTIEPQAFLDVFFLMTIKEKQD